MRILAIRGENLTSLAVAFEVDFEAEPIRSAGIFAITGPTGAGKTTLLDAICLALFDSLPRLDSAERSASVGRIGDSHSKMLGANDVRKILRHGAGAGYAEVDFVAQDGRHYRSRWEVHYARRKATGNLQPQKIVLTDLATGQIIGDKKTDTLQHIEQRIGLSFGQFRRSVMLAQGDFDTFIKAQSKERAELLERITGTEIYSKISKAAFERTKQEREALEKLETQLGEHRPLNDEEREEAEQHGRDTKTELDRIEAEKNTVKQAQAWYQTQDRLAERVEEGEIFLTQAETVDQAAEPERAALAATQRALMLRAELERASASAEHLANAEKMLAKAQQEQKKAIEARDSAISAVAAATALRDEKRSAYDAIGPELDEAQRLDALIEAAKTELAESKASLDKNLSERDAAQKAITRVEAALQSARNQRDSTERWLDEHSAVESLAARIDDVSRDLTEWSALKTKLAETTAAKEQLVQEAEIALAHRQKKETELAALRAQEEVLAKRITAARKIADEIDKATTESKRDTIVRIGTTLGNARRAAADAEDTLAALSSAQEEAANQLTVIQRAGEAINRVDTALPDDIVRLDEARRSLDLSEAAASDVAEHLRLKLVDGQPCPVCGASEHPVTEVDRLLKQRVTVDRKRVTQLDAVITDAKQTRTRAETQIKAAEKAREGALSRQKSAEVSQRQAQQQWRSSVVDILDTCKVIELPAPVLLTDVPDVTLITPFQTLLDKTMGEISAVLQRVNAAEAEATRLSVARDKLRNQLAAVDIDQLKDDERTKIGEVKRLDDSLQSRQQMLDALSSRLDAALAMVVPDWKVMANELQLAQSCNEWVKAWQIRKENLAGLAKEISSLEADLEGKRATFKGIKNTLEEATQRHSEKQRELAKLSTERASLIEGRPVGEVRTAYRKRWEAADKALNQAELIRSTAEQTLAARTSETVTAQTAIVQAKQDLDTAQRLLTEKLAAAKIALKEAETAVAKGETWAEAEQARLDAMRLAVSQAKAALDERKSAHAEHQATGTPDIERDQVESKLSEIETRRVEAEENYIAASAKLTQDNQARSRSADIKTMLDERREKAKVRGQLDDLIGSADGAKFRRFAQSLTLNHLIQLANQHLADLNPRYELQRAPGGDLVLQVIDRDMADEVRGVHNLSGGERFLISLALALGLASTSSGRGVKVESLFIDEGFGALDGNSLAVAVSVLEQLQATGRRVGVISHVEELKERIAVRVEISPQGGGRSEVQIVTA